MRIDPGLKSETRIAFKEWASVCEAVADGSTLLLLRKGGIDEGREGFRVAHHEFWFFPTRFHQSADELIPEAAGRVGRAPALSVGETGPIEIGLYGIVSNVWRIDDANLLPKLRGLHILSEATVRSRFEYRTPGLFALVIRAYRLATPHLIHDLPRYVGCHSWVELDDTLSTAALQPVMDDVSFANRRGEILTRFNSGETAGI